MADQPPDRDPVRRGQGPGRARRPDQRDGGHPRHPCVHGGEAARPTRTAEPALMPDRLTEAPLDGGTNNEAWWCGGGTRSADQCGRPAPAIHALLRLWPTTGSTAAAAARHRRAGPRGAHLHPGDAVSPPNPAWALTDDALRSVAKLLRRYHEAVAGFARPGTTAGRRAARVRRGSGLPRRTEPGQRDLREGRAAALIDFDLANPGSAGLGHCPRRAAVGTEQRTATSTNPAGARYWTGADVRRRVRGRAGPGAAHTGGTPRPRPDVPADRGRADTGNRFAAYWAEAERGRRHRTVRRAAEHPGWRRSD